PRAGAQFDQGIGFLAARGEQTAGTMVFEGSPHDFDTGGQQCRCEGVAHVAAVVFAIEAEPQCLCPIDTAPTGKAVRLSAYAEYVPAHERPAPFASSTWRISWVRVS